MWLAALIKTDLGISLPQASLWADIWRCWLKKLKPLEAPCTDPKQHETFPQPALLRPIWRPHVIWCSRWLSTSSYHFCPRSWYHGANQCQWLPLKIWASSSANWKHMVPGWHTWQRIVRMNPNPKDRQLLCLIPDIIKMTTKNNCYRSFFQFYFF